MSGKTCSTFGAPCEPLRNKPCCCYLLCFHMGFTAILGNLITLRETVLIWYRMGITSLSLLFLPAFWRGIHDQKTGCVAYSISRIMVSVHWVYLFTEPLSMLM